LFQKVGATILAALGRYSVRGKKFLANRQQLGKIMKKKNRKTLIMAWQSWADFRLNLRLL